MKEQVEKFLAVEKEISHEKGDFSLFALFLREDAQDKWDLVVAAPWIDVNQKEAYNFLVARLKKHLQPKDLVNLSRIVIVNPDNPALVAISSAMKVKHGIEEVQDSNFFGLPIKHAFIITSTKPKVEIESPSV